MEYMRGLLRDNDLFRAYVTVRVGLAGWRAGVQNGGPTSAPGGPRLAVGGACLSSTPAPAPIPHSGRRSTSSASG